MSASALAFFVVDRVIKWWVTHSSAVMFGQARFSHLPNSGAVFSLPVPSVYLLAASVLAVGLVVAVGWHALHRRQWQRYFGAALMFVGGVSNLLDRLTAGSVSDVVWLPTGLSFNLADVYLVLGLALVVLQ